MSGYKEDLAYIHDAGFSRFVRDATPGLIGILREHGIGGGLVVDLGCGSGRLAQRLNRAGYAVFGVDSSPSMIELARRRAPESEFRVASILTCKLPVCDALLSTGECLNYTGDPARVFERAWRALRPGGIFVFDVSNTERFPKTETEKNWWSGRGWAVEVRVTGDRRRNILTRNITSFRTVEGRNRRSDETHKLTLYRPEEISAQLRACGFRAERIRGYGRFILPRAIAGFLAIKPHAA